MPNGKSTGRTKAKQATANAATQSGILADVPRLSRYHWFDLAPNADPRATLKALAKLADGSTLVVGIGQALTQALDGEIRQLRLFPRLSGPGFDIPSTPSALWCWLRGDDQGDLVHRSRALLRSLAPTFLLSQTVDAFVYQGGKDLTGYEDGTENPTGQQAVAAAILADAGPGLDGSSFVAVQQWLHDLDTFDAMSPRAQDDTFGRRKSDNEEFASAPTSAHVKRTAQESFDPQAFILRRSMPWSKGQQAGLVFVAFGKSFDAYEALLSRMVGIEDGGSDALFNFTRPLTGAYFWCPPMAEKQLDLRALKL